MNSAGSKEVQVTAQIDSARDVNLIVTRARCAGVDVGVEIAAGGDG